MLIRTVLGYSVKYMGCDCIALRERYIMKFVLKLSFYKRNIKHLTLY